MNEEICALLRKEKIWSSEETEEGLTVYLFFCQKESGQNLSEFLLPSRKQCCQCRALSLAQRSEPLSQQWLCESRKE